jgi:hypothetical protein
MRFSDLSVYLFMDFLFEKQPQLHTRLQDRLANLLYMRQKKRVCVFAQRFTAGS